MLSAVSRFAEISADKLCGLRRYSPGTGVPTPIIAHRGAWNLSDSPENSMAAFLRAKELGASGIECDVRFTKDLVPVIHHDAGLLRVFRIPGLVDEWDFKKLRAECPAIPRLSEVLALKNLHFMIDIKTPLSKRHMQILSDELDGKIPAEDYHLLAFEPALVREHPKMPAHAWMLVGELCLKSRVELSLKNRLAGVAGHYLAMTQKIISRLHAHGQKAGVGFTPDKNLFNREWARGVDFVFTNSTSRLF